MAQYLPLDHFKAIYVVDLCTSLCEQARKKVTDKGWSNVHVVEGDACNFTPPEGTATLVTFSYSLSSRFFERVTCFPKIRAKSMCDVCSPAILQGASLWY